MFLHEEQPNQYQKIRKEHVKCSPAGRLINETFCQYLCSSFIRSDFNNRGQECTS